MTFQDLGLSAPILRAVLTEGYTIPTPIQTQTIPLILKGSDVLGCAQTGTGKTAAFALPILDRLSQTPPNKGRGRRIRVLVLASTRELALQINESFSVYGQFTSMRSTVVYGGVGQGAQVRALQHGVDIVIATPGRLMDLMEQGYIDLQHIQTLVLDEADRMLDMGFLPAIRRIMETVPKQRQTLLFSATMPGPIAELANSILHTPHRINIAPVKKTTDLVDQSVCFVPQRQKVALLISMLQETKPDRVLVFTRTKFGADKVCKMLVAAGIKSDAIHSNKSQNARQRILASFKWKNPPVLVATDIAARGIDVDNITHVFNIDLPSEAETYVHRIGRSGRAGTSGIAISFCDVDERRSLREIERLIGRKIPVLQNLDIPSDGPSKSPGQRKDEPNSPNRDRPRSGADRQGRTQDGYARSSRPHGSSASGKSASGKSASGKSASGKSASGKRDNGGSSDRSGAKEPVRAKPSGEGAKSSPAKGSWRSSDPSSAVANKVKKKGKKPLESKPNLEKSVVNA